MPPLRSTLRLSPILELIAFFSMLAPVAEGTSFEVVCIENNTEETIIYNFSWGGGEGHGTEVVIRPGEQYLHSFQTEYDEKFGVVITPIPHIRFNSKRAVRFPWEKEELNSRTTRNRNCRSRKDVGFYYFDYRSASRKSAGLDLRDGRAPKKIPAEVWKPG